MCAMQEVGKENMFTFGVEAEEVDQLREDRKNFKDYDPRWTEAFKLIYDGKFGDKEYFKVTAPHPRHGDHGIGFRVIKRNLQFHA